MKNPEACLFDPDTKIGGGIYSFMVPGPTPGVLVCLFGGATLEELKAEGIVSPAAFVCSWEEALRLNEGAARQRYCKGPSRVTEERWWEMLEVLYPARWEHFEGSEIFMMPECITGSLYTFGVRIEKDYFLINEDCNIKASDLVQQCKECPE